MQVHLTPDKTFFVQLAVFVAVLFGLVRLVFKPWLKIFALRREKGADLVFEAKAIEVRIGEKTETHIRMVEKAKQDIVQRTEDIRRKADLEESAIRNTVKLESARKIEEARASLYQTKDLVVKELEKDVGRLADQILERIK